MKDVANRTPIDKDQLNRAEMMNEKNKLIAMASESDQVGNGRARCKIYCGCTDLSYFIQRDVIHDYK